jgi:HTH-type transcriptional regulator/antitoxin HigA
MSMTTLAIDYIDNKSNHKFHIPVSAFKKPTNAKEYARLDKILDELIDEVRDNEKHPLAIVMQIIGENLEQYDNEHHLPIGHNVSEVDMVKHLMKSRHLHQKDLADIFGGQANVSKFLNGERSLSKGQIIGLKNKFGISADFFVK